ncbi:MAG: 6-phosphogluconolactonase [Anaerolineae bacterium]
MSMVRTVADASALAEAAAGHFALMAEEAIAKRGRFAVALSGGSTPRRMYERLAQPELAERIDWLRVHVFWGDERAVPPEHPESNYRMAHEVLLSRVPIPAQNIHRIRGELAPEEAAKTYEAELRQFFSRDQRPVSSRFDLVLLGMGEDGHTASLFPGAAAINETDRWVVAYYVEKLQAWRITLTPVVLNAAAQVTFLVSGAEKAARLRQVLYGPYQPQALPAQIIRPAHGRLLWLIDEAAAGLV